MTSSLPLQPRWQERRNQRKVFDMDACCCHVLTVHMPGSLMLHSAAKSVRVHACVCVFAAIAPLKTTTLSLSLGHVTIWGLSKHTHVPEASTDPTKYLWSVRAHMQTSLCPLLYILFIDLKCALFPNTTLYKLYICLIFFWLDLLQPCDCLEDSCWHRKLRSTCNCAPELSMAATALNERTLTVNIVSLWN